MTNFPIRAVLNVFLASPSDLKEERKITRSVVDDLNQSLGRVFDWHIELLGWEDTLPGCGRPQAVIDEDVDKCDLFVGMLWKRWGQHTGTYTSGFEEEFERARERRKHTGTPEIWLFFKRLDPSETEDPGVQLTSVLAFRESLVRSKEFLFKDFDDTPDWRRKLQTYLSTYVAKLGRESLINQQPGTRPAESSQPPESGRQLPTSESSASSKPLPAQLGETLKVVTESLEAGHLDYGSEEQKKLESFQIARLDLTITTLIYRYYDDELLTPRTINTLFKYREELDSAPRELYQLMRSLVGDPNNVRPGWYWFKDLARDAVEHDLSFIALSDDNEHVRSRALDLITALGIRPHPRWIEPEDFVDVALRDEAQTVRKATLEYLKTHGTPDDLKRIQPMSATGDSTLRDQIGNTRLLILARHEPGKSFAELIDNQPSQVQVILGEIEKKSPELSSETLTKTLEHKHSGIRELAVRELSRRKELDDEKVTELLKDPSEKIREYCFRSLIGRGREFGAEELRETFQKGKVNLLGRPGVDVQSLIIEMYKSFPFDRLSETIDWFSVDGPPAYQALALYHFAAVENRIRTDLEGKFQDIKRLSLDRLRVTLGDSVDDLEERFRTKGFDESIQLEFTAAALAALAEHGRAEDVRIARLHTSSTWKDVRLGAIKIIDRFGDVSDVKSCISIAQNDFGELRELAARAALKLEDGQREATKAFLASNDTALISIAIRSFLTRDAGSGATFLDPLLTSSSGAVRLRALAYFAKTQSEPQLEQLLQSYLAKSSYYYHVVCWLDRFLYAPSLLRAKFRDLLRTIRFEVREATLLYWFDTGAISGSVINSAMGDGELWPKGGGLPLNLTREVLEQKRAALAAQPVAV